MGGTVFVLMNNEKPLTVYLDEKRGQSELRRLNIQKAETYNLDNYRLVEVRYDDANE